MSLATGHLMELVGVDQTAAIVQSLQNRMEPATGPATICGVMVVTDDSSGLAKAVSPLRIGGRLSEIMPQI